MKNFNLALAFVAALSCLLAGAVFHTFVLIILSLFIAVGVFLLNRKLEQRNISQRYQDTRRPALHDEIHAPDFFE
jgi:CHASE3 domain sensor protein